MAETMSVLQALFFPPEQPGGVSSMVPFMVDEFRQAGWDMELFSLPKRLRNKGTEDIRFTTFDWSVYQGNPIVDKYMQTFKDYIWWTKLRMTRPYDVIHAHHPIAGLVMKRLNPDVPVVMTVHSSFERELALNGRISPGGPEERFLTSIYRELEATVDVITTVSHTFKQYIGNYMHNPERIRVVPNGYDEKRFRPFAHENDVTQLIAVCRLVPAKGVDVLLEACARLKRKGHSFVLHLIGDGPIREELERKASDLSIYEETIFYGYMLHPEQFMPFSDIFVLPSRAESFGSVFAEAALCRLALVGTDVGGISEQIEHGVNGLLVPVNDPAALAAALEVLIADPAYRSVLAEAAWTNAKSNYALSSVVERIKAVYAECYETRKAAQ